MFRNKIAKKNVYLNLFKDMSLLRSLEETLAKEYHPANQMRCPVHFCVGQEAVPSVLRFFLKNNDYVFSHHRSHGYFFSKSLPLQKLVSELYGKQGGANKGFAGSQDVSLPKKNFFSGAILSGSIGVAVGKALDEKSRGTKNVVISAFGESACDVGLFWESVNYSNLKKLPIIFLCENNNYSVFSPQSKRQSGQSIFKKVQTFSKRKNSFRVDGNNVFDLMKIFDKVFSLIRKGHGPFFIEAMTYRISSHYGPENDYDVGYRTEKEVLYWKKKCPIEKLKNYLLKKKVLNDYKIKSIEKKCKKLILNHILVAKKDRFLNVNNLERLNYDLKKTNKNKIKNLLKPVSDTNSNNNFIIGY